MAVPTSSPFYDLMAIPNSAWAKLSEKKIYFAHQSLGYNIIDGIKDTANAIPLIRLNIVESDNPGKFELPIFAHSRLGRNTEPESKMEAFASNMENGIGNLVDYAFLKFCYVDIKATTDIKKVCLTYKHTLSMLKEKYPQTIFIHLTVPLTSVQYGIKSTIKKIIGKPIKGHSDNIARNRFNAILMEEYFGKEPVFDLARIESTFPSGARKSFVENGELFYTTVPSYTYDGGHLNRKGRKRVAEQLLAFLAGLSDAHENPNP